MKRQPQPQQPKKIHPHIVKILSMSDSIAKFQEPRLIFNARKLPFHYHREDKGGGGVALIFKHSLKLQNSKSYNFDTFECIFGSLSGTSSQKINFIIVYRFGKFTPAVFLSEFYNFIESIFIHVKNFII